MTYGEKLLSMSTLFSGNTAKDHLLNVSKPDTIYAEGTEKVYVKQYTNINSGIVVNNVNGRVNQLKPSGLIISDTVTGNIEIPITKV